MADLIEASKDGFQAGPQGYTIEVLDSCEPIRDLWQALEADAHGYGFQTYAWVTTLLDTVGRVPGVRPAIVLVSDRAERPVMLLPLMVRRQRGLRRLEFIDFGLADYNAPLIRPDALPTLSGPGFPALWRRIVKAVGAVDIVRITKIPEKLGDAPNPFLTLGCRTDGMSFQAPLNGGFEGYLSRCSTGLMADTRAKRRRLARQGAVAYRVAAEADEADRLIDAMVEQKSRRFQTAGIVDRFLDPAFVAFYRTMARREGGRLVHLCEVTLDDQIIAVHFGMVFGDRLYWLMPAFDLDRFGRFSPGRLLMLDLIQWACAQGLAVFDFTIGGESYKLDWATATMPLYALEQGVSSLGRIEVAARDLYRHIRDRHPDAIARLKTARARVLNALRRRRPRS